MEDGNGGIDYNEFEHDAPSPVDILEKRLLFWLKNIEKELITRSLPSDYRTAVEKRLQYILDLINKKHPLIQMLSFISGSSSRLCLSLSIRLLINNIVPYDKDPENPNLLEKALLNDSESNLMPSKDAFVTNVFRSGNQADEFSILPLRILSFIHQLNDKNTCNLKILLDALNSLEPEWEEGDIKSALNKLLMRRKALIFTDHRFKFSHSDSLDSDSNETFYISRIGLGYIEHLIYDIIYLQECFFPLSWDENHQMPKTINMQNDFERFDILVKGLRALFDTDITQIGKINSRWRQLKIQPVCISALIISRVGNSMYNILHAYNNNLNKSILIESWLGLLERVQSEKISSNEEINLLIGKFKNELSSIIK
jgi:hypothetical protein